MVDDDPFVQLQADVDLLATNLLPQVEAGELPTREQDLQIRAFLVLAHSAIEELIEDRLHDAVAGRVFIEGSAPPVFSLSLACKYAADIVGQNEGKVPPPREVAMKLSAMYYQKAIKPNNGIRTKSIESMCKPLGLDVSGLGPDCDAGLTSLDTLGAKRGSSAHTFRGSAKEDILPDQARGWVDDAVKGIKAVIEAVEAEISKTEF